ncbi:DNA repair nuclease APEX1 [Latimeria chalumnae]|uniref:DNA repair nuclease/redox regulator APEX1 n=1 Tax=Latimeria chalumnae TaxID=7897 RepID=H3AJF3_LATCH|nr:PREDICTED: DNA-(apurinic or apyrimidinic site) lyase [Latimeria chalumnae]|eukprot:XP_006009923.1 PREDICTED: DNA-(apurinic or apyrimidinic site) lyase [Latimeria chalumnae]
MPKRGKKEKVGNGEEVQDAVAEPKAKKTKKESGSEAKGTGMYEDPPDKLTSTDGKTANWKITSWNVDGLRAWIKKNGLDWVREENPDVLCLQETKCAEKALPDDIKNMPEYPHKYWACSDDKEGYSGVAMLCKNKPLNITYGIGIEEHDKEGRVITAEFDRFFLVTAYIPNAGRGLVRLEYRQQWDVDFRAYLKSLDARKPLVLCGDLNVAHQEIDLKNPKGNKKNAGFTKEERDGFTTLLAEGFIDSFRHLYPDAPYAYTFWTYMMNCRAKNVGWRLDYFVLSEPLVANLCDSKIRSKAMGSDHCAITLYMAI